MGYLPVNGVLTREVNDMEILFHTLKIWATIILILVSVAIITHHIFANSFVTSSMILSVIQK